MTGSFQHSTDPDLEVLCAILSALPEDLRREVARYAGQLLGEQHNAEKNV
jgi:hypothetical protein